MKEEAIIQTLNKFASHFGIKDPIDSLHDREKILQPLKEKDQKVFEILHHFIMLYESFNFVKTDKMLMLKARDIWKMETDRMMVDLYSEVKEIEQMGEELGVDLNYFRKAFEK